MHYHLSGISSVVQCSSSKGMVWKSSASSSMCSEVARVCLEIDHLVSDVGYCTCGMLQGEETSSSYVSSSEGLYVNLLHTGLRQGCLALHGVTGTRSKEVFSMLETW